MFNIIPKILFYKSFRRFDFPKMMPLSITIVSTNMCNSLCKTCNIGKNYLEDPVKIRTGELELWEYEKIFKTIGHPYWATVGGGEPFMRPDFADIVVNLIKIAKPKIVNIPSNGTMPPIVLSSVKKILEHCNGTKLVMNMSLDGIGKDHDEIRGFQNNFDLLMKTIGGLKTIEDSNFVLGINTVISKYNVHKFPKILDFVENNIKPDSYIVEHAQIRPEFYNIGGNFAAETEKVISAIDFFTDKLKQRKSFGFSKLIKSFRIRYYEKTKDLIKNNNGHDCYSSFTNCQIMMKGDVWSNAILADNMGNLRDFDLNFRKLWFSKKAKNVRRRIRSKKCHCELANVSYPNMLMNFTDMMKVGLNFLRY